MKRRLSMREWPKWFAGKWRGFRRFLDGADLPNDTSKSSGLGTGGTRSPRRVIWFSQVDATERFGDDKRLGPDDWIETTPVNAGMPDPESSGLPPIGAPDEVVYRVADGLSKMREKFNLPRDGVYCPVCHIANVSPARLRTPCPKCGRPLLKFGWE